MVTAQGKARHVSNRRNMNSNLAPVKVKRKEGVLLHDLPMGTQINNTWLRLLFLGFCSSSIQKFFPHDRNKPNLRRNSFSKSKIRLI